MPKRKKKGGRSTKFPILTLAALAVPVIASLEEQKRGGNGIAHYLRAYTGFNYTTGQFEANGLILGYGPLAGVFLGKMLVKMARVRVPKFIPISLS